MQSIPSTVLTHLVVTDMTPSRVLTHLITTDMTPSRVLTHLIVTEDAHADAQFVLGVLGRDDRSDAGPSVLGGARSTATLRAEK